MNSPPDTDWSDLAGSWHAETAAVSVDDIDAYLRRQRRQLLLMTLVELALVAVGVVAALWLAFGFAAHLRWMGLLIAAFALVSAVAMVRTRRHGGPAGTSDLAGSLRESIAWQEWLLHELRFGRALNFVTLLAGISVLSVQLRELQATSAMGFAASAAVCTSVLVALAWNLVLTRRARRRSARLRDLSAGLAE